MHSTNTNIKAKRGSQVPPYRLIYKGFLEDVGEALREGAEKYNEGRHDRNYQHGDEQFYLECIDHVLDHIFNYMETGQRFFKGEDQLAHAAVGIMMLMWAEDFAKIGWPYLDEERPGAAEEMPETRNVEADVPFEPMNIPFNEPFDWDSAHHDDETHAEEREREEIIEREQKKLPSLKGWFKDFLSRG